jgi:signal transduction histidine kinase
MQEDVLNIIKNKIQSANWIERLKGVVEINELGIPVDDKQEEELITLLSSLVDDPKWEVRRSVASTLANYHYIKVEEITNKLAEDSNKWVKETAERSRRKLKINASTDKRDRKYDEVIGLIRKLKRKYPEELNDEILDDILKSILDTGEKYYEELASDATHQIKTALTPINQSIEELRAEILKDTQPKKETEQIFTNFLNQMKYLKKIIEDLRDYSKPCDTDFTAENLESILKEALSRAKNNAYPSKEKVSYNQIIKIDSNLTLEAHREGLINAFTNIICNAFESMPSGGTLEITAIDIKAGYVSVLISDAGNGMTSKQIEDAKKRWTSTKKKEGHTGLGLPIAIKIIERGHKGRVTIGSKEGQGTTVNIELPIQREKKTSL